MVDYASALKMLGNAYESIKAINGATLQQIGQGLSGYTGVSRPQTNGYQWFWELSFSHGTGKVAIRFPWKSADGKGLEKGIETHVTGNIRPNAIEGIITQLICHLVKEKLAELKVRAQGQHYSQHAA